MFIRSVRLTAFWLFIASGFCGLVYQVVWLRLIMARFGVNAPVAAMVLSTFMAGLGIGSYAGGRLARGRRSPLRVYALAEFFIALSAPLVPVLIATGQRSLNSAARGAAWGSTNYFLLSGLWIAAALLPWCVCMGATFPLMIAGLRRRGIDGADTIFSYLYLANVAGAAAGTVLCAFVLIELLGLRGVLWAAACVNLLIAITALLLSRGERNPSASTAPQPTSVTPGSVPSTTLRGATALSLLFLTGLISMALEVLWLRLFIPQLGTVVYVFACILAVYLVSNALGTWRYRRGIASSRDPAIYALCMGLGICALLPLASASPLFPIPGFVRVILGVMPFCVGVGFVTPALVDRWSHGEPARVGKAYAVNVVGCIIGPLVAGFWLLPVLGERVALIVLAAPLLIAGWVLAVHAARRLGPRRLRPIGAMAGSALVALLLAGACPSYDELVPAPKQIRRDYEATSIATGTGMKRHLLINGVGITSLTPITKMMAHLPLAYLDHPPQRVLVIAFGMGTSFRSALSWDVPTTVVDLVPSVPGLFSFYHDDADELLKRPTARVIIDDGRRLLERSSEKYDVIIIDPPPPVEAAGCTLLYSNDFYRVAREHLSAGGILQQWFAAGNDDEIRPAVVRAIRQEFPHVRTYRSLENWGLHMLASAEPIPQRTAAELAQRLGPSATRDLLEWNPHKDAEAMFAAVLSREMPPQRILDGHRPLVLSDNRPMNEYFMVRRYATPVWNWWFDHFLAPGE